MDTSLDAISSLVSQGTDVVATDCGAPPLTALSSQDLLVQVTHDLRSPLAGMLVLIERLRAGSAGPVTPLQEQQLGLLYSATFGIAALTNDALDMAGTSGAPPTLQPATAFSVRELWGEVLTLVQPIIEEKRLHVRYVGLAQDRRVGHRAALHRVLLNLVTNALKFTSQGTVTVTAEALSDHRVQFTVRDSGSGNPEELQQRLSALNTSLNSAPTAASTSGGLGLALCQRLLFAMGGRLALITPLTSVEKPAPAAPREGIAIGFTLTLPPAP